MHAVDKVGQSAIGDITSRKDCVEVNHFLEGLVLLQKLHDQEKWVESLSKHRNDYDNILVANPHLTTTQIQRDLNGTYMSAVYNIMQFSLRSKCDLLTYKEMCPCVPRFLKENYWNFAMEVEAVLCISKDNVFSV